MTKNLPMHASHPPSPQTRPEGLQVAPASPGLVLVTGWVFSGAQQRSAAFSSVQQRSAMFSLKPKCGANRGRARRGGGGGTRPATPDNPQAAADRRRPPQTPRITTMVQHRSAQAQQRLAGVQQAPPGGRAVVFRTGHTHPAQEAQPKGGRGQGGRRRPKRKMGIFSFIPPLPPPAG